MKRRRPRGQTEDGQAQELWQVFETLDMPAPSAQDRDCRPARGDSREQANLKNPGAFTSVVCVHAWGV